MRIVLSHVRRVLWPTASLPLPFNPLYAYINSCCSLGDHAEKGAGSEGKKGPSRTKQTKNTAILFSSQLQSRRYYTSAAAATLSSCVYAGWLCLHAFLALLCSSFPCWMSLGGIPACLSLFEGWQLLPVLPVGTFFSPVIRLSLQAGLWGLFSWFVLAISAVDVICLAQQASRYKFLKFFSKFLFAVSVPLCWLVLQHVPVLWLETVKYDTCKLHEDAWNNVHLVVPTNLYFQPQ